MGFHVLIVGHIIQHYQHLPRQPMPPAVRHLKRQLQILRRVQLQMRSGKRDNLSPQIQIPRLQPANPSCVETFRRNVSTMYVLPRILQRQFSFTNTPHPRDRRNGNSLVLLQLLV
jgi:hypothetical protein